VIELVFIVKSVVVQGFNNCKTNELVLLSFEIFPISP
jgi:hypothetical protein